MANIGNIEIRGYIRIRNLLGISAQDIQKELKSCLSDRAPQINCVRKWINRFKQGGESLEDQRRSGRPKTAVTPANIRRVAELVEENPHVTYDEIEAETLLHPPSIKEILNKELNLKKISSRWVPHQLTDAQKKKRVDICKKNLRLVDEGKIRLGDIFTGDESWIYHRKIESRKHSASWLKPGEKPAAVVKRGQFEAKTMFSIFFRTTGVVHIDAAGKGEKINNQYYIENCLKPVVKALEIDRSKCGSRNLKILHDNARPHVHQNVNNFLKEHGISTIEHPPYSPDLAPCDFWLFSLVKSQLDSHPNVESLKKQITKILFSIDQKEYSKTFHKWLERMHHCINNNGDYFEHLIK